MGSSNDSHSEGLGFDSDDVSRALGSSLDSTLAAWVEQAAVNEAAAARARRHWLTVQAEGESSLAGVLVDLGERGRPVVLAVDDLTVRGRIVGIGSDFVVVERDDGRPVIVALDAVAMVRSAEDVAVWGDRQVRVDTTLAGILGPIAAERPEVTVRTSAGSVNGVLRSAGADVARIRLDGGSTTWIAVAGLRVVVLN